MKIQFNDGSYIECSKSNNPNKIMIIISAKDNENPLKKINNAVEISVEEFKTLISDMV
jgi:hypothetical protein